MAEFSSKVAGIWASFSVRIYNIICMKKYTANQGKLLRTKTKKFFENYISKNSFKKSSNTMISSNGRTNYFARHHKTVLESRAVVIILSRFADILYSIHTHSFHLLYSYYKFQYYCRLKKLFRNPGSCCRWDCRKLFPHNRDTGVKQSLIVK